MAQSNVWPVESFENDWMGWGSRLLLSGQNSFPVAPDPCSSRQKPYGRNVLLYKKKAMGFC